MLKNAASEAIEEPVANAINFVADIAIAKGGSKWVKAIEYYVDQGYSESEALGKAFGDQLLSMGLDALDGGILALFFPASFLWSTRPQKNTYKVKQTRPKRKTKSTMML